jgi:hypothetical protein
LAVLRKELLEVQLQKGKAHANPEGEQELAVLDDLEKRLRKEITSLGKENQSLATNMRALMGIQDRDKKNDDDDKDEKSRDVAERF